MQLADINPRYMWLDPASGKNNQKIRSVRARSAIVVVGVDPAQRIYVLDAWADRVGTNGIVTAFIDRVVKWGPMIAAYEDQGQQSLLEDPLRHAAAAKNITLPLVPVGVSTKVEKNWRIRTLLQPLFGRGRLLLASHLVELHNEITSFPMSTMKDMIDALASCCSLVPPERTSAPRVDEARELADYLRREGVPPHMIEAHMRSIDSPEETPRDNWMYQLMHRRDQAYSLDRY